MLCGSTCTFTCWDSGGGRVPTNPVGVGSSVYLSPCSRQKAVPEGKHRTSLLGGWTTLLPSGGPCDATKGCATFVATGRKLSNYPVQTMYGLIQGSPHVASDFSQFLLTVLSCDSSSSQRSCSSASCYPIIVTNPLVTHSFPILLQ
jgi:hypothetical protein